MRILFLFIALLSASICAGQKPPTEAELKAQEHIKNLQEGILLVRLFSKSKGIEAIRAAGNEKAADELEESQRIKNLKIVKAFESKYSFSQVYFFYSHDSKHILSEQWDQIKLLNFDLNPALVNKDLANQNFYVAEFSNINGNSEGNNSGLGFKALVIMDDQLKQLSSPFPYYQKSSFLFVKKTEDSIIEDWNEKLSFFSNK